MAMTGKKHEKMKAALTYGPGDIRVELVDKPACPDGGFVLKIEAVGLCGSDIRNMTTDSRNGKYPWIFGHEIVGCVCETDAAQLEYKVGDRLYIYPAPVCMECENCRSGHSENCSNRYPYNNYPGGYAQYIAIDAQRLALGAIYRIPDDMDYVTASLGEPMSSVYACEDNINVKMQDTVVIIGAGPIGCLMSRLAKMRGAVTVIMIDISDTRLDISRNYGVDCTINSREKDPVKAVMAYTNGRGADKVISANPSVEAQAQSIYMARKGGVVVFFGGVAKGAMAQLDTNHIHYNNLMIYGHYAANAMQVQKAFELICDPSFGAREFVTHVLPLDQINHGIELTRTGEAVKVILEPWA